MTAYYKTTIQVEVLSRGPYFYRGLRSLAYDVIEGDCSGQTTVVSSVELTRAQIAEALRAQGSDPSFLIMDEDDEI